MRHCGRCISWRLGRWPLALWFVLAVVLAISLSAYLFSERAAAAGPTETITVTLAPSSIVADGVSTSTATAVLRFGAGLLAGQTVVFSSSDSGIHFGPTIDNLDGTYTAMLSSSTAVGAPTITATSQWAGQTASGRATLTQTPGPAKNMTLSLEPQSIIANGRSYTAATAKVADAHGNPVPTDRVIFSSSDPREEITATANNGNGTYSVLIKSSTTLGQIAIQATDPAANLTARSELSQVASGSLLSLVTMQWTFDYTPGYTKVRYLTVYGAPVGASVVIDCHGRGCPFTEHVNAVTETKPCGPKGKRSCQTSRTIDLAPDFQNRRLRVGTRITVAITQPLWVGEYYQFTVRSRRAPRVHVACLAPDEIRPDAPC
jgi:hypothetical protein